MADTMRAVIYPRYGSPKVLQLRDMEMPSVENNQLLVRVRAAAANPVDYRRLTGTPILLIRRREGRPGWRGPKNERLGADYAGVVETVGRDVTGFRPGDEVFGVALGAFAEYVVAREEGSVTRKPAGVSFEHAAAVPVAAVTALQGLRDHGLLQPGQRVLINGASGGVGTYAVQIAKALGAEVTGVCSTRNLEMVRSIGADHVIDYTRGDFTLIGQRYDLLLDNVGTRSWAQYRRILQPEARLVMAGGPHTNVLVGPLLGPRPYQWRLRLAARSDTRTIARFHASIIKADMEFLAGLMETGKLRSVIERTYRLDETADALRHLGRGHVAGKLIILP